MPQVAKQTGRQGGRQRPIRAAAQTTKLAAKRQPIKANLVAATPCGDTKNNHWKNGDNNKYKTLYANESRAAEQQPKVTWYNQQQ